MCFEFLKITMIPACRLADHEYEASKGDHIDCGHARCVFEVKGNSDLVLKEVKPGMNSHNENEATFYSTSIINGPSRVTGCIVKVLSISKSGKYLTIEKLCTQLDPTLKSGAQMPVEIDDPHARIYGMTSDKKTIKCIDYGTWDTTEESSGMLKPVPFQSEERISEIRKNIDDLNNILD
ncbi:hypothetical protein SM107_000404 [Cronobacter sakazakii]|uniref:hypothetical protein n=1 Tax=Cronobacter sakazakii TaxID=28141 RepID=UPI00131A28B1|nr:hypothetical protein [Cronobacter sakazakii]EJJ0661096.1 hypothetical protein [Cronobacter sakazakii]EJJ0668015.1 hypothetical protein [Cronobacter sakazakii]ELY2679076.1 hypothetical protein [Cronobacter sakazakii]ELY4861150.1 hypothetical protein [Cronobacter sakazakii]